MPITDDNARDGNDLLGSDAMPGFSCSCARSLAMMLMMAILVSTSGCQRHGDESKGERNEKDVEWDTAFNESHEADVRSIGKNILVVSPGTERIRFGQGFLATLTPEDATEIGKQCPAVIAVAPVIRARGEVEFKNRKWVVGYILGTNQHYLAVRDWTTLKAGKAFSEQDISNAAAVCLIGKTVVQELFDGTPPLGQTIQIERDGFGVIGFRVIGILDDKGKDRMSFDQDDVIMVPWTAVGKLSGDVPPGYVHSIWAKAASSDKRAVAMREIAKVLRQRHQITQSKPDDFNIVDVIQEKDDLMRRAHTVEE